MRELRSSNQFGHGELHKAVISNDTERIKSLVADGYDTSVTDSVDFTAEELAIVLKREWLLPFIHGKSDASVSRSKLSTNLRNKVRMYNARKKDNYRNRYFLDDQMFKMNQNINVASSNNEENKKCVVNNTICQDEMHNETSLKYNSYINRRNVDELTCRTNAAVIQDLNKTNYDFSFDCRSKSKACSSLELFPKCNSGVYDQYQTHGIVNGRCQTNDSCVKDRCLTQYDSVNEQCQMHDSRVSNRCQMQNSSGVNDCCERDERSVNYRFQTDDSSINDRCHESGYSTMKSIADEYYNSHEFEDQMICKNTINNTEQHEYLHSPTLTMADKQNEDWEIWDFDQNIDTQLSNDVSASSQPDKTSDDVNDDAFEGEDWMNTSTKSSFTSSFKMDTSGNKDEAKSIYVFSTRDRSLSESCDGEMKSKNATSANDLRNLDISLDEPRGFAKSFSVNPSPRKSKKFLSLPFLKKSSSSTSINQKQRNNSISEDHKFTKSYQPETLRANSSLSPTKMKNKSSSFISLFRKKSNSSTNDINISSENISTSTPVKSSSRRNSSSLENKLSTSVEVLNTEKVLTITVPQIRSIEKAGPDNTKAEQNKVEKTKSSSPKVQSPKGKSTFRPESGYSSHEDLSPLKNYSITFTPEHTSETKESSKNNKSPKTTKDVQKIQQQALLSVLVGVGLGEESATNDVIQNTSQPHSVKETGTFTLGKNNDLSDFTEIKIPTKESEYCVTEQTNINNRNNVIKNNKLAENTNGTNETGVDKINQDTNMEEFQVLLDTNYDYPKYSTPSKLSPVQVNNNNETERETVEVRTDNVVKTDQLVPNVMIDTFSDDDDNNDYGMKLGDSTGQLPSFSELHIDDNDEHNTGVFTSVNSSYVDESESFTPKSERRRFRSTSNGDEYADSMQSFEQHEQEYVLLSQNGLLSPLKAFNDDQPGCHGDELSVDEEDEIMYQDYTGVKNADERRMTIELLNYMPPILERSMEATKEEEFEDISDTTESRPSSQIDDEKCPLRLSTENLKLHDEGQRTKSTSREEILKDFVNVVLVDNTNEMESKTNEESRGLISPSSNQRIQRQLNFDGDKDKAKTSGEVNVKTTSEKEEDINNHGISFEVPLEDCTSPIQSTDLFPTNSTHITTSLPLTTSEPTNSPPTYSIEETQTHPIDTIPRPLSSIEPSHQNEPIPTSNKNEIDDFEERKRIQKKCLWYKYSIDDENQSEEKQDNADKTELNESNQGTVEHKQVNQDNNSLDVPDVTTLIQESEDVIEAESKDVDQTKATERTKSKAVMQRDPSLAWDGLVSEYEDEAVEKNGDLLDDISETYDGSDVDSNYDNKKCSLDVSESIEYKEEYPPLNISNKSMSTDFLHLTPSINDMLSDEEDTMEDPLTVEMLEFKNLLSCADPTTEINANNIEEDIKSERRINNTYVRNDSNEIFLNTIPSKNLDIALNEKETKAKHFKKPKKIKENRIRPSKVENKISKEKDIFSWLDKIDTPKISAEPTVSIDIDDFDVVNTQHSNKITMRDIPANSMKEQQTTTSFANQNVAEEESSQDIFDSERSITQLIYNKRNRLRPQSTEDYTVISFDDENTEALKKQLSVDNKHIEQSNEITTKENEKESKPSEIKSIPTEISNNSNDKNTLTAANVVKANVTSTNIYNNFIDPLGVRSQISREDDRDSGMDLMNEDNNNEEEASFKLWLDEVKPTLHDPLVIANLFVRLADKHAESLTKGEHIQMAHIVYKIVTTNNKCNFNHVILYLFKFLGYKIKVKINGPVPKVTISNILEFLDHFIRECNISVIYIETILEYVTRPNIRMIRYHNIRVRFIDTCFEKIMLPLRVDPTDDYLLHCFRKLNNCFSYLDNEVLSAKTNKYLIPYLNKENDAKFTLDILKSLGLMTSEKHYKENIYGELPGSLLVLKAVYLNADMTKTSQNLLKTYLERQSSKFQFSRNERLSLIDALN